MKKTDYLIVGAGLAGICFAETLLQQNKSFKMLNTNKYKSTQVAAGIYNPVVLKRFTIIWKAKEQLELLKDFYKKIENRLQVKIEFKLPVLRKLFSAEEQNNWFEACDKQHLSEFLNAKLYTIKYENIESPFQFGEVYKTGYVDTKKLKNKYIKYLTENNLYSESELNFELLKVSENDIQYENEKYSNIVFCEGYGLKKNKYFNYLPLDGTKGEIITIKAPELNCNSIINSSIFILPISKSHYKIGATYNWEDKTEQTTQEGLQELENKLKETINCDYEIVKHEAGIRPTVKDRRPLVGTHSFYKNIHILNGLGTRGVLLGPSLANYLYQKIENNIELPIEIDIKRFKLK